MTLQVKPLVAQAWQLGLVPQNPHKGGRRGADCAQLASDLYVCAVGQVPILKPSHGDNF